jgi:hypothetical protein
MDIFNLAAEEFGKTRSISIHFPKDSDRTFRLQKLVEAVRQALNAKGNFPVRRLGLCATDFESQVTHGIDTFFGKISPKRKDTSTAAVQESCQTSIGGATSEEDSIKGSKVASGLHSITALIVAARAPVEEVCEDVERKDHREETCREGGNGPSSVYKKSSSNDMEYARMLQASYDRENELLSSIEAKHASSLKSKIHSKKREASITNFFSKKKR